MKEKDFVAEMKDRYVNGLRESCINSFHINTEGKVISVGRLIDNFSYSIILLFNGLDDYELEIREYVQAIRDELIDRLCYLDSIDRQGFIKIFEQVIEDN